MRQADSTDIRSFVYSIGAVVLAGILREELRRRHGIWRGSLFPDSAGAANMAREVYDERA